MERSSTKPSSIPDQEPSEINHQIKSQSVTAKTQAHHWEPLAIPKMEEKLELLFALKAGRPLRAAAPQLREVLLQASRAPRRTAS